MEPAANIVEALQVATLEEGRIHANVFTFGQPPEYSFRLWRWTKFREGWKRAQIFKAADIKRISLLLERLENMTIVPEPAPDSKPISLELREYAPNNLVETFTYGTIRAFVCHPRQPKPMEPFFVLRKQVEDMEKTASWFYASDVQDLQTVLLMIRGWFQQRLP